MIAGIDYKTNGNDSRVWIRCGTEETELDPLDHAKRLVQLGAGEIILNSIDRDGEMMGYDLVMAEKVASALHVPSYNSRRSGNFAHLAELLGETSASAAACASLFHFGDNNPIRARSYLKNLNIPNRVLK